MKTLIYVIVVIVFHGYSFSQQLWYRLGVPLEAYQTLREDTSLTNLKNILLHREDNFLTLKYSYAVRILTEKYAEQEKEFLLLNLMTIEDTIKLNRSDLNFYIWYNVFQIDMITRGFLGDNQAIQGMRYLRDNPETISTYNLGAIMYLAEAGIYEDYQTVITLTNSSDETLRKNAICLLKYFIKNPTFTEEIKNIFIPAIQSKTNAEYDWFVNCCINGLASVDTTALTDALENGFNNSEGELRLWYFEEIRRYDKDRQPYLSKIALTSETNKDLIIRYLPEYYYVQTGRLSVNYANFDWINFISNYYSTLQNQKIKNIISYDLKVFKPINNSNLNILEQILNLINTIDSVYTYTWLGVLQFKDELQSILQSAKTNLQNGDSLASREDVKAFQDSVDFVYADSLNQDPRFVTLEGWKFLYWNAQYILDRLPEIPSTEGISTYSIFATHGVWLEQNSEVLSGNIGVNEIGESPFMDSGVELSIGISTETPAGFFIKANRIKVKQNASVSADVYYNELDNNGTITGTLNTPLELPLFVALPEFHTSAPGTENIVVPQNGEYTLTHGAYGDIQVKKNGKLIFTGGEYHINNFTAGDDNQILFQSQSEVRIKDKFNSGQGSYIGPQDTTTLSANEIIFYVEGINGNNGNLGATPKAAKIGLSNTVKANFYVPNGTLWLRQNSEAEGAFIGKDVDVGIGVKVILNSSF